MSLKAFHIFFIALSVLITLGFAAWVHLGLGGETPPESVFLMANASGVLSLGLLVYGIHFIRKSRHIII